MQYYFKFMVKIVIVIGSIIIIIKGEYQVLGDSNRAYIQFNFTYVKDEKLPNHIQINISLTEIKGTLLYSIDKFNNQLVISLHDDNEPIIKMMYRNKFKYLFISKLCKCDQCKYIPLYLDFIISKYVNVKCNFGEEYKFDFNGEKLINYDYPVLPFNGNVDAIIWLVNTPHYKDVFPNNVQLSGCIFNVEFSNKKMISTISGKGIKIGCKKTCTENICNSGVCYETYDREPICNCHKTFFNGNFCNESKFLKLPISNSIFMFKSMKMSWNSSSLSFNLSNVYNSMLVFVENEVLKMQYSRLNRKIEGKILLNYNKSENYILIWNFQKRGIDYEIIKNNKSIFGYLPTDYDLSQDVYTDLSSNNNNQLIDVLYKSTLKECKWKPIIQINRFTNSYITKPLHKEHHVYKNSLFIKNKQDSIGVKVLHPSVNYKILLPVLLIFMILEIFVIAKYQKK